MKRIIVFGGSFDPIHLGHLHIAERAISFFNADKCLFLPSSKPRWKNLKSSSEHRLKMLELALKDYDKCEICLEEINSNDEVNYSYNTMLRLMQKEEAEYYFLIGADQLNMLHEWYRIDDLSNLVQIITYRRKCYELNKENLNRYHVQVIEDVCIDISSTEIRTLKKLNTKKEVLNYIVEHDLYFMDKLHNFMSLKRLNHVISVAKLAFELALANNLDPYKAFQAGLLHDITRELDFAKSKEIMTKDYREYLDYNWFIYHQFTALEIIKNEFGIDDDEILEAIKYHCTGKANMSPLGKLIYAADKIEPTRNYDSSHLIKACMDNLEKGFIEVLKANREFLSLHNDEKNPLSEACYNYYL